MKLRKPWFIVLLGRPGSGKGTQADLLEEKFNLEHMSSGQLLRQRAKRRDFLGRKINAIQNKGGLVPTPVIFQLWMPKLESFRKKKNLRGILFDGSPRKLYEARMLEEVLEMYGWADNVVALNVVISPAESLKRLLKRGRADDDREDIVYRLKVYKKEVVPVLKYFRKKGVLIDISGEQSVEAVHREILRKLHLK